MFFGKSGDRFQLFFHLVTSIPQIRSTVFAVPHLPWNRHIHVKRFNTWNAENVWFLGSLNILEWSHPIASAVPPDTFRIRCAAAHTMRRYVSGPQITTLKNLSASVSLHLSIEPIHSQSLTPSKNDMRARQSSQAISKAR